VYGEFITGPPNGLSPLSACELQNQKTASFNRESGTRSLLEVELVTGWIGWMPKPNQQSHLT